MRGVRTPRHPDARAWLEIEPVEFVMALLCLDLDLGRSFEMNHGAGADEFLADDGGFEDVPFIRWPFAAQVDAVA